MKTSNIILISFFSIVGIFLLSMLIQVAPRKIETERQSVSLPQFRHLVVNSNCKIILLEDVKDSIRWIHKKNTNPAPPNFTSKGDTLFINWQVKKDELFFIEACSKELESVYLNEATLSLTQQLNTSSFQINGSQCKVTLYDKVLADSISIDLKNGSNLSCSNTTFKSANIKLESSEARFYNVPIDQLTANISQNSVLSANQVLHANITKDASSKFYAQ